MQIISGGRRGGKNTRTEEGKLYALKLYRFYREQGLPPFMAMSAMIDSGRVIAVNPYAYLPKITARAAMSVWAGQQYMQWIQVRMTHERLHTYWFTGQLHAELNQAIARVYRKEPEALDEPNED